MHRILFTIKKFLVYRKSLRAILGKDSRDKIDSLLDLTLDTVNARSIKALVLDFDGVLAPHGAVHPLPCFEKWLANFQKAWPHPIFILSNNAYSARDTYFKNHFPTIHFVKGMRRKPYPDGLLHIADLADVLPSQILMVDDRLLTGILASLIAGTQCLLITKPVRNLKQHFFKEIWFSFLRGLDKLLALYM